MPERALADHWRLLVVGFLESSRGRIWSERLSENLRELRELLSLTFGTDLALPPQSLDREHLGSLVSVLLPGRLLGTEAYASDLPDVVEDFVLYVAENEGLATAWEWSSAVSEQRPTFEAALKNPARPRPGSALPYAPERRKAPKLGRNDACFCGSGRKYKHCCGRP